LKVASFVEETGVSNPQLLLNNQAGVLNSLAVMKHFPTLSKDYVNSQWENFKRYDQDGNGELDMSEVKSQ